MAVKTIKDVDDITWRRLKSLSAQEGKPMGSMLRKIVEEYRHDVDVFWKNILSGKRLITNDEAENLERETRKIRRDYGFRS